MIWEIQDNTWDFFMKSCPFMSVAPISSVRLQAINASMARLVSHYWLPAVCISQWKLSKLGLWMKFNLKYETNSKKIIGSNLHLNSIFCNPYIIWGPSKVNLERIPIWIFYPTSKHTQYLPNLKDILPLEFLFPFKHFIIRAIMLPSPHMPW